MTETNSSFVFCVSSVIIDADAFIIQHLDTGNCLGTQNSGNIGVSTCNPVTESHFWKWGSGHRLFHVATSLCLSSDVQSKSLSLVDCGSNDLMWWRCHDGAVYTANHMGLSVSNSTVAAKRDADDTWIRRGSQDNICQRPYSGECALFLLAM